MNIRYISSKMQVVQVCTIYYYGNHNHWVANISQYPIWSARTNSSVHTNMWSKLYNAPARFYYTTHSRLVVYPIPWSSILLYITCPCSSILLRCWWIQWCGKVKYCCSLGSVPTYSVKYWLCFRYSFIRGGIGRKSIKSFRVCFSISNRVRCCRVCIFLNLETGWRSWTGAGGKPGARGRKKYKNLPLRECSIARSINSTIVAAPWDLGCE